MNVAEKLQSLLTASNTATGETDTTLTDAVQRLVNGYGGGELPFELESVTEYVHAADWFDDTNGNALNFAKTYCNFDDETDRKLYVAYITENDAALYNATYLMIQRNGAGASAFIGQSVRENWANSGGITSGRSFRISAGAKIKVFVFKWGGIV